MAEVRRGSTPTTEIIGPFSPESVVTIGDSEGKSDD